MIKPYLCPYAEYCREAENGYAKCASCIFAQRRSYWRPVKEKKSQPKKTPEKPETPDKMKEG